MLEQIKWVPICLVMLLLLVTGCSTSSQQWPTELGEMEVKEEAAFRLEKTIGEKLGLLHPTSLHWIKDSLYITDTDNERIVISDKDGKLIRTVGETGNGPLQFIKPTGITKDARGNIYVVDAGNNRVQVLDNKDNFLKEYVVKEFPYLPDVSYLNDITVHNGTIFLTTQTMDQAWATVISITEDGKTQLIGKEIAGHIVRAEDKVQFVSEGEYVEYEDGKSFESGRNYMINILPDNQLGEVHELPYKYTAGDIQSHNQELYMFSKTYLTLDRFDLEGNYVSSSYRFRGELDELMGLESFAFAGDDVIVLNSMTSKLYLLKKELQ